MNDFFLNSAAAGVVLSLASYFIGTEIKRRWKWPVLNPLLISIVLVIGFLLLFRVDYDAYNGSARYLSYLLTPATVSLAVPLYQQMELLKKNMAAVCIGILSGVLASLCSVLALAALFRLSHEEYVTLLPKSITTAVIIVTGVLGNMTAEQLCRVFRIKHAISKGIAIGSASHAIGTAKAMEMGEVEGAMSSLAIVISGVCTVAGAAVFAGLY